MRPNPTGAEADAPAFSRRYKFWLLSILIAVNVLNMADRQGLAAVAPAIKTELTLTDTQMGLIQGLGFAIFYSLMGLPLARLADSGSRARIVGWSVAVFGVMVVLCGTVRSFAALLLCRIGVAMGDAGFGPPVGSLVGDHFAARSRTSIMTIIWLGAPVGALLGSLAGGMLAETYGWRSWFYIASVPAFAVAILVLLTLREPPRGMSDGAVQHAGPPPPMRATFAFVWSKTSMRFVLLGAAFGAMALNGIGQFLARFLTSALALSYAEAGQVLGILSLASMALGFALGGFGMSWAARYHTRWYVLGPGILLLASVPLLIFGFAQRNLGGAVPLLLLGQIAMFAFYTPTIALAQNMVGSRMRASSSFLVSLVLGLVGTGLGPTVTGILSDRLAAAYFGSGYQGVCQHVEAARLASGCLVASAEGLRRALMAVSLLAGGAGLAFILASRTLAEDMAREYVE